MDRLILIFMCNYKDLRGSIVVNKLYVCYLLKNLIGIVSKWIDLIILFSVLINCFLLGKKKIFFF